MENTGEYNGDKEGSLPLLLTMAIPPTVSMLLQSLYNVVDSIFCGPAEPGGADGGVHRLSAPISHTFCVRGFGGG